MLDTSAHSIVSSRQKEIVLGRRFFYDLGEGEKEGTSKGGGTQMIETHKNVKRER